MSIYFVTGIDTDAGKTYATGILARSIMHYGRTAITQKIAQTGSEDVSSDISTHRQLMQVPLLHIDSQKLTCPYTLPKPASPHLAAKLDGIRIDHHLITRISTELARQYNVVLLEGAGGALVPITEELLTLDYVAKRQLPVILVTNAKLGSINHTLLTIEAIKARGLQLHTLIFNHHFDTDSDISHDTRAFLITHLGMYFPETHFLDLPSLDDAGMEEFCWDVSQMFEG